MKTFTSFLFKFPSSFLFSFLQEEKQTDLSVFVSVKLYLSDVLDVKLKFKQFFSFGENILIKTLFSLVIYI